MNKNKWIAVIVVLIVIIGALAGYLIGKDGKSEESSAEDLFPKIQDIAGAPKIECVGLEGKIELAAQLNKEHWENIGALSLEVKVKNTTDPGQTLLKATLIKTIFDKSGAAIGLKNTLAADVLNLKPGEVKTINLDMISVNAGNIGKVELLFRDDYQFAEPTVSPAPTTSTPSAATTQPAGNTYTTAPKNPQTPGEVLVAFYFLINDGKYLDAARLIEKVEPEIEAGKVSESDAAADLSKIVPGEIKSIQVEHVDVGKRDSDGSDFANVIIKVSFKGGLEEEYDLSLNKENNKWKIALSNF